MTISKQICSIVVGFDLYHQTSLCEKMQYKYQRGLKKLFLFISAFMFYCCEKSTWSQTHKSMDFGSKKVAYPIFLAEY